MPPLTRQVVAEVEVEQGVDVGSHEHAGRRLAVRVGGASAGTEAGAGIQGGQVSAHAHHTALRHQQLGRLLGHTYDTSLCLLIGHLSPLSIHTGVAGWRRLGCAAEAEAAEAGTPPEVDEQYAIGRQGAVLPLPGGEVLHGQQEAGVARSVGRQVHQHSCSHRGGTVGG